MASNQKKILQLYSGGEEDGRAVSSKSNAEEFYYTKKYLDRYIQPDKRVIELGCATGYYGMYFADRCREYLGVDLSAENIEIFQRKIARQGAGNLHAQVGDATTLTGIPDDSFDVVLVLGPMYHLPPEERLSVFEQCRRIGRKDAVIALAYINRIGVYAGACVNDKWRDIYPNEKTNRFVFQLGTDDERPGVFYFTSPEEMESDCAKYGFTVLQNCGLDFFFAASAIENMNEAQLSSYRELADRMSASRSCVGLANHALLICRKEF